VQLGPQPPLLQFEPVAVAQLDLALVDFEYLESFQLRSFVFEVAVKVEPGCC
jgi:hypothetical protein